MKSFFNLLVLYIVLKPSRCAVITGMHSSFNGSLSGTSASANHARTRRQDNLKPYICQWYHICVPFFQCPDVLHGIQQDDEKLFKDAQKNFCGSTNTSYHTIIFDEALRNKTLHNETIETPYVCCQKDNIINRDLLAFSADEPSILTGGCGMGGWNLLTEPLRKKFDVEPVHPDCNGKYGTPTRRRRSNATDCDASRKKRMMAGGQTHLGQNPWIANVYFVDFYPALKDHKGPRYGCMGTIISQKWILSSWFCQAIQLRNKGLDPEYVSVGEYDIEERVKDQKEEIYGVHFGLDIYPQLLEIRSTFAEREFHGIHDTNLWEAEVSMFKLNEPIVYNRYVQPICLPTKSEKPPEISDDKGKAVFAYGYGYDTGALRPGVQRRSIMKIDSLKACNKDYSTYYGVNIRFDDTVTMCVTSSYDDVACGSDTGGPLLQQAEDGRMFLIGVKTYGGANDCALKGRRNLYSSILPHMDEVIHFMKVFP